MTVPQSTPIASATQCLQRAAIRGLLWATLCAGVFPGPATAGAVAAQAPQQADRQTERQSTPLVTAGAPQAFPLVLPSVDTPLFKVDGEPVTWPEFSYWLKHARKLLPPSTGNQTLVQQAVELARKRLALKAQARRLGIVPTEQDLQELRARREKEIRIYGGVAEYLRVVSRTYVSEQVYEDLARADLLGTRLLEQLYGTDGETLPQDLFERYVEERQLLRARVLFVSARDARGKPLDPAAIQQRLSRLHALRAELDGRPGAEIVFERRVVALDEDRAADLHPDGRILGLSADDRALHDVASTLAPGRFAAPLVTPAGLYLLQRLPLGSEHRPEAGSPTLRYLAAYSELFGLQLGNWIAGQQVTYGEEFERLDLAALLR